MGGSNLPPGCRTSDIPGNRPEDFAWEAFMEWADEKFGELCIEEARRAVLIGIAAVKAERTEVNEFVKDCVADALLAESEGPGK